MQKLLFSVFIFLFYTQIFAQFSGGSGTALDPYQVATKADLNNVRNHLSSHFIQTSNIMFDDADFQSGGTYYNAGAQWEPISAFTGTYDGNNHVIDGIKVNRPSTNSIGVFGHVSGATTLIENLGVSNVNIVGQNYVGGLVGSTIDVGVIIQNCFSTGSINGNGFVGGLVGDLRGGPIVRYSYSTANVAGVTYTGGLVGGNTENGADLPSISNCYSTGDVTIKSGTDHRNGAFIGENYGGSVTYCYSIGGVYYTPSGSPTDKGFIGNYLSGTISNNFFDVDFSNQMTGNGATGISISDMKTQATFTTPPYDWDFGSDETDWVMSSEIAFAGYPTFRYTGGYSEVSISNQIASVPNLVWVAENSARWANNYTQTADLNMWTTPSWDDEKGWTPMGNTSTNFTGDYNGEGFRIFNLYSNRTAIAGVRTGLFGVTNSSNIIYLGLVNALVKGPTLVGALVGHATNGSLIEGCYSTGKVIASIDYAGVLIGRADNSNIAKCYSSGSVYAYEYAGGLIGTFGINTLSNSYSTANVFKTSPGGFSQLGAFCGVNQNATIQNCYSTGNVVFIGGTDPTNRGFLGVNNGGTNTNNFFDSDASNQTTAIGATAKTTAEMKTISTFTDATWNFTKIWNMNNAINNGYPYLRLFYRIYVDDSKADDSGIGVSWFSAKKSFQSALNLATNGYEIWVASGTYKPSYAYDLTNTSRYYHFRMIDEVEIFGGFAGTESPTSFDIDTRNFETNASILSGDIGTEGVATDNCYHVLYHPNSYVLTSAALLDGFIIEHGYANGSSPHTNGAGMHNDGSSPTLKNLVFRSNEAFDLGGAMYFNNSSTAAFSILAYNNSAYGNGGAVFNNNGSITLTNFTIADNFAWWGAGIYNFGGTTTLNNSIVWGNEATTNGHQFFVLAGTVNSNYNIYSNIPGVINDIVVNGGATFNQSIDDNFTDPQFVDFDNQDYRIFGSSSGINSGNNSYNSQVSDVRGKARIAYTTIDRGAYEWTSGSDKSNPVYVSASFSSGNPIGFGITHYNNLTTALTNATTDATVNISNYTHTGNVDMTGRTFIVGAADFNLTGNLSGGLIQASGTGKLKMNDLSANTTKTFPITDGTYNYTMTVTTANNTNPDISVRISDLDPDPAGSINSDFWNIEGPLNLNATVTLRVDKAAIAPKTLSTNSQLRYFDGTKYAPVNGNNFSIQEFDTYYIITLTGVNKF